MAFKGLFAYIRVFTQINLLANEPALLGLTQNGHYWVYSTAVIRRIC